MHYTIVIIYPIFKCVYVYSSIAFDHEIVKKNSKM